jgi:hypothetical protein
VHAFFRFVAINEPALGLQCRRILAIPVKRYEHGPVEFLTEEEVTALVAAPDSRTWIGSRDRALLLMRLKRACVIANLLHSGARMLCLAPVLTFIASAKAGKCVAHRYGQTSLQF